MGGSEKGCEWWLGAIFNKIEISNLKISLINYIHTPPNPTITDMLTIENLGTNIHLARKTTPTQNEMKARLPDESTIESTHIETLQLSGIIEQVRQIHIFPKMQTAPLI